MKKVRKYLKINRELMFEYLKIYSANGQEFDKEKAQTLYVKTWDLYEKFDFELKNCILKYLNNKSQLKMIFRELYVEGFASILCTLETYRPRDLYQFKDLDKKYLSFRDSINLICSKIINLFKENSELTFPVIDCDKYNISGKYFGRLEIEHTDEKTLPPQQTEKPKPEQEAPKTFDELFYNIELVQQSIDVLKEIEPPLIDTDYNYIGKLKGIICVWIDELQRQGIVKSNYPKERKLFASLIPKKINRFSIDESMFGKYQKKAEDNYRTDIKAKVSKIKLSQNSH